MLIFIMSKKIIETPKEFKETIGQSLGKVPIGN